MLTTILNHCKFFGESKEFQGYVHTNSFGFSCVNNQNRNTFSLNILPMARKPGHRNNDPSDFAHQTNMAGSS